MVVNSIRLLVNSSNFISKFHQFRPKSQKNEFYSIFSNFMPNFCWHFCPGPKIEFSQHKWPFDWEGQRGLWPTCPFYPQKLGPWGAQSNFAWTSVGSAFPFLAKSVHFHQTFFKLILVSPSELNFSKKKRRRRRQNLVWIPYKLTFIILFIAFIL